MGLTTACDPEAGEPEPAGLAPTRPVFSAASVTDPTDALVAVPSGAGTFHFALPAGVGTTPPPAAPGLTWSYVGQATFNEPTGRIGQTVAMGPPPSVACGDIEHAAFIGSRLLDSHGREFELTGYVPAAVDPVVADYTDSVNSLYGFAETPWDPCTDPHDPNPGAGDRHLHSWSSVDSDDDTHAEDLWFADTRVVPSIGVTERAVGQYSAGRVGNPVTNSVGDNIYTGLICSAVVIGPNTAMTSAHCVADPWTGNWRGHLVGPNRVFGQVCIPDPSTSTGDDECGDVVEVIVPAGIVGSTMFQWPTAWNTRDFALLRLNPEELPIGRNWNWLGMSIADATVHRTRTDDHFGYPGMELIDSTCDMTVPIPAAGAPYEFRFDEQPTCARELNRSGLSNVTFVSGEYIGGTYDAEEGQSGGPLVYYPAVASGRGMVTGLHTGWHLEPLFPAFNGGPRSNAFRRWAVANSNDVWP